MENPLVYLFSFALQKLKAERNNITIIHTYLPDSSSCSLYNRMLLKILSYYSTYRSYEIRLDCAYLTWCLLLIVDRVLSNTTYTPKISKIIARYYNLNLANVIPLFDYYYLTISYKLDTFLWYHHYRQYSRLMYSYHLSIEQENKICIGNMRGLNCKFVIFANSTYV